MKKRKLALLTLVIVTSITGCNSTKEINQEKDAIISISDEDEIDKVLDILDEISKGDKEILIDNISGEKRLDNLNANKIIQDDYTYFSGYQHYYTDKPLEGDYRSIYKKNNNTGEIKDLLKDSEDKANKSKPTPISIVGDYLYFGRIGEYSDIIRINILTDEVEMIDIGRDFSKTRNSNIVMTPEHIYYVAETIDQSGLARVDLAGLNREIVIDNVQAGADLQIQNNKLFIKSIAYESKEQFDEIVNSNPTVLGNDSIDFEDSNLDMTTIKGLIEKDKSLVNYNGEAPWYNPKLESHILYELDLISDELTIAASNLPTNVHNKFFLTENDIFTHLGQADYTVEKDGEIISRTFSPNMLLKLNKEQRKFDKFGFDEEIRHFVKYDDLLKVYLEKANEKLNNYIKYPANVLSMEIKGYPIDGESLINEETLIHLSTLLQFHKNNIKEAMEKIIVVHEGKFKVTLYSSKQKFDKKPKDIFNFEVASYDKKGNKIKSFLRIDIPESILKDNKWNGILFNLMIVDIMKILMVNLF